MKSLPNGLIVNGDLDLLETSIRELKTAYLFKNVTETVSMAWYRHFLGVGSPCPVGYQHSSLTDIMEDWGYDHTIQRKSFRMLLGYLVDSETMLSQKPPDQL